MSEQFVRVTLPYATYGFFYEGGRVTEAPPIAHWMVGKDVQFVAAWLRAKGAEVQRLALPVTPAPLAPGPVVLVTGEGHDPLA